MSALRWLAFSLFVAMSGTVLAYEYSIQVVAVREVSTANEIVNALTDAGFDAHTESVVRDGVTWLRVRVGCFTSAADAALVAAALLQGHTREAVVVERTEAAPHEACVVRDVGFVVPEVWQQRAPGLPSFDVQVAGVDGIVRFVSGRWQVLQSDARPQAVDLPQITGQFEQSEGELGPYVVRRLGQSSTPLCLGTLLAEAEDAAVVLHEGTVAACRLASPEAMP